LNLRFPYQNVPIFGSIPPTLFAAVGSRPRPLVPVRVLGAKGFRDFPQALVDTGAVDSVFPDHLVDALGIVLIPSAVNQLRWRGLNFTMRFGRVQLELTDGLSLLTWQPVVAFSTAPIPYPLLGHTGCLEYLNAQFFGSVPELILETNALFPGTSH
jgi:hypothetical protein